MGNLLLTVEAHHDGTRADKFLASHFPEISRTKLQKLFDNEEVLIDGETVSKSYTLAAGESMELPHPRQLETILDARKVEFDVIYEDKSLLAINKASGIAVHPVSAEDDQTTIAHGILAYLGEKARKIGPSQRPCIVHRLDKETSGVLLIAKTPKAFERLKAIFAQREIVKEYLAIVRGCPDLLAGSIVAPIARSPKNPLKRIISDDRGKNSRTDWERMALDEKQKIALIKCQLHTGRTHQARVHLAHLGHPVLGDTSYGYRGSYKGRILLHAYRVELPHPTTGTRLEIVAELPADLRKFKTLVAGRANR